MYFPQGGNRFCYIGQTVTYHVIKLFSPVTLCMAVVVATISSINYYTEKGTYLVYTPFHEQTEDVGTLAWQALANAGIILGVIAVMTVLPS